MTSPRAQANSTGVSPNQKVNKADELTYLSTNNGVESVWNASFMYMWNAWALYGWNVWNTRVVCVCVCRTL